MASNGENFTKEEHFALNRDIYFTFFLNHISGFCLFLFFVHIDIL